jgi:hypothetical protein
VNIEWLKFKLALAMLALSLAVLPGCSMLRIGYKQLDTFAVWTADEYFDLEQPQRREFLRRFDRLHEWHRYEQLPEYVAFLAAIRTRVEKGFTREDYLWIAEGVRKRYRVVVNHATDDIAAMLMTVTPAQLESLQRQWDKVNRRFIREYRLEDDAEEQRQARARRLIARIREWVGSLSDEQEARIVAMLNASDVPLAFYRLRLEDRQRRQREFLQLMAQRGDPPQFTARLRHWLLNWEEGRLSEFARLFRAWEHKQADIYAALDRTLTPQQRAAAAERLQGFADDFAYLAQRPSPPAAAVR